MNSNVKDKVLFATPKTFDDRAEIGRTCVKDLKIDLPMVVDEIDNRTERAYTAWPDRLYVIDAEGRVAYKGRPGPFGVKIEPLAPAPGRRSAPPGRSAAPVPLAGGLEVDDDVEDVRPLHHQRGLDPVRHVVRVTQGHAPVDVHDEIDVDRARPAPRADLPAVDHAR